MNFEIYNYLIDNKHIDKLNDMLILNFPVSHINKLITKNNIIFDDMKCYIPYTNGKVDLITGKLEPISKKIILHTQWVINIVKKEMKN